MATTEEARHELYKGLEEVIGPERASTLMEYLPPVGWADVATKHDLSALEERLDLRLKATRDELRGEIREIRAGFGEIRGELGKLEGKMFRQMAVLLVATVAANAAVVASVVSAIQPV